MLDTEQLSAMNRAIIEDRTAKVFSKRFEVFIDFLWGLTVIFASILLTISFFAPDSLGGTLSASAMWFIFAALLVFVHIYWLHLRRNIMFYLMTLRALLTSNN